MQGPRKEVQKSASVGVITSGKIQVTLTQRRESVQENLLIFSSNNTCSRASAEGNRKTEKPNAELSKKILKKSNLTLDLSLTKSDLERNRHSPEIRQKKLQQAKEEFLNSTPTTSAHTDTELTFPTRNRLSQMSVESESSCDIPCAGELFFSWFFHCYTKKEETCRT